MMLGHPPGSWCRTRPCSFWLIVRKRRTVDRTKAPQNRAGYARKDHADLSLSHATGIQAISPSSCLCSFFMWLVVSVLPKIPCPRSVLQGHASCRRSEQWSQSRYHCTSMDLDINNMRPRFPSGLLVPDDRTHGQGRSRQPRYCWMVPIYYEHSGRGRVRFEALFGAFVFPDSIPPLLCEHVNRVHLLCGACTTNVATYKTRLGGKRTASATNCPFFPLALSTCFAP